jgi:5-methyltetrahydropteroyltriglutamate--homocysteine methyltransferase
MPSPYRADHVGSLLRPPEMLAARRAYNAKQINWEQLRNVADEAALKAIEVQTQAGVDVLTDGEYRRAIWSGALRDSLEGLVEDAERSPQAQPWPGPRWSGPNAAAANETLAEVAGTAWVVGGKLRMVRNLTGDEAAFLKQHAPGPWKITLAAAPRASGWWKEGVTDRFYASPEELDREILGFRRAELKNLIDQGCSYIQLDSLRYTAFMNPLRRQVMIDQGLDLDKELDDQIAWDNASIEGARRTPGVTVGHHICRGNNRSAWSGEGGYEPVAEKLFNTMKVDRFLLEYDTERAGGFEPLRFVPPDKMIVLGLVSSKLAAPESKDMLKRRIEEATKYISLDQLAISPQCGFASTMPGNMLSWDEQRRKLELVVELAREVWGGQEG